MNKDLPELPKHLRDEYALRHPTDREKSDHPGAALVLERKK